MSSVSESTAQHVQQLDWSKKDGTVTVTPRNQDRFLIQMRKAIEILQRANEQEQFERQFNLLLKVLAEWISGRDDLGDCYVTLGDGALAFIVVRKQVEYDGDFEDELSSLDYQIANDPDLDLIHLNAMSLPPVGGSALNQFIDRNFSMVYAGGE